MRTVQFSLFGFKYHAHPGFWLFLGIVMLFSLQGGNTSGAIIAPLAVALAFIVHELGHAATARLFGLWVRPIELGFLVGTTTHQPTTPWRQFAISISGPFAGFVMAALAILISFGATAAKLQQPWLFSAMNYLAAINVMLSCFNLLPIIPFDGGNAVRSAVTALWGVRNGWMVASGLSVVLGTALALFGLQSGMMLLTAFMGFAVWQNIQALRELQARRY